MKLKYLIPLCMILIASCASHKYIVYESEAPKEEETKHWKSFVILGIIPVENDLNQQTVCPGRRIRAINQYDSMLDGAICGATLFIYCPHMVGIECVDANPVKVTPKLEPGNESESVEPETDRTELNDEQ